MKEKIEKAIHDIISGKYAHKIEEGDNEQIIQILQDEYDMEFYEYEELELEDLIEEIIHEEIMANIDDDGYYYDEFAEMTNEEKQESKEALEKALIGMKELNKKGIPLVQSFILTKTDSKTKEKVVTKFDKTGREIKEPKRRWWKR